MKKTHFKKALSLIMAVVMIMSCWVWVAPQKAEAAAGSYTVTIKISVPDTYDMEHDEKTISVSYYGNNGSNSSASTDTTARFTIADSALNSDKVTRTYTVTCAGYPAKILFSDGGLKSTNSIWNAHVNVEVLIGSTVIYNDKDDGGYTFKVGAGDNVPNLDLSTDSDWSANKPYAKTFTWSNTPEAMQCPKSGTTTQTVAVSAKDQYDVQMYDPTWSVKGSVCGTTGISVSSGTSNAASTNIQLTNAANVSTDVDTQTGTVTATWGDKTSSKDFTITDSYYTATFNYQTQNSDLETSTTKTETREGYHGDAITAPTAPSYYDYDYLKTFSAWSPAFASTITKDVTYTATYSSTFVGADYTAVDEAIAAWNAIKDQYGSEYEFKYTYASRMAVEVAVDDVVRDLGRTQQSVVDNYASAINEAVAALEPNKFDVIFLDRFGAILLYDKGAEFETSVTPPELPDDQKTYYDANNHYTYTGWDSNEYTSVVDDLVINPVYTAEAHSFTTSTVTSDCVTKGATKYTCSCGYSYTVDESGYGDHKWATEYTVDVEPTCTLPGSKSIHCTICGVQNEETKTEVPAKGHQFGTVSSLAPATCDRDGIDTKLCDECGVCEHVLVPAIGHDYVKTTVDPTCTAKGYDEYVCQNNGCKVSYRDNYTDVAAHSYGEWETVTAPTCGVAGVKKQTCSVCNHVNIGSIDALKHGDADALEWDIIIEATCTGTGYQTKTCLKCNNVIASQVTDALGHNYVVKEVVDPTCTAGGYTVEECDRANCGAQRITNETAAKGHAWTKTTHDATCTSSAYIEYVCGNDSAHNYVEHVNGSTALTHDFTGTETIITAATCTTDGEKTVQCSRCDETTTVVIPKLGHSYSEWVKVDATNDTDGSWTHTCANCNNVETVVIPKGGHNLVKDQANSKAPLCNEKGKDVYICDAHENCSVKIEIELDYAQHTVAQKENPAATCTQTGKVEAYCSVCSKVFSTTETPVKAHSFDSGTVVAPTCTTSGYTTYECTECDFSYNEYDESKPATGHNYKAEVTTAATCTQVGEMTYTCQNAGCTDSYTEEIPAKGHSYTLVSSTDADCTNPATETYKCDCGDEYTKYISAATGHTWSDNWETVSEATENGNGVEKRKCTVCDAYEYRTTAPIGDHKFTEAITTEATCTETGVKTFTCQNHENCPANYTEVIPAKGHTQKLVYTAPTCIAAGSTEVVCEVCTAQILYEEIPVVAHNYGEGVILEGNDATCETEGKKTFTCTTDGCNAQRTETIPAKGHDLTTTVNDAKCGEEGSVITTCKRCGKEISKTTLAAKGHIWGETPTDEKDATCTEDGYKTYECQNCTETNTVVLPKLGHDWGEWTVTKASTNTAKGELSRKCSRGCTESVEIPEGGHNLVVDTDAGKDATCKAEGTIVYKCENHTDCGVTLTVAAPLKQHTIITEEQAATCTQKGYVKTVCSECGTVFTNEVREMVAHVYKESAVVDATCTTSGYSVMTCSCGDSYNVYDASKPATGHTLVEGASTATCTNAGLMTITCKNCTAYNTTVNVPALGHDYVEDTAAATEATCAAAATKTYKCSRDNCTSSYTISVGEKTTEHIWDDTKWEVKQSATESSIGYKTNACTVCGQLKVETIEATGEHKFEGGKIAESKDATCTEDGYEIRECTVHPDCGKTAKFVLPKLGHNEELQYTAATCEGEGSTKIVCTVCKAERGEVTIPALGHLYGEGTVTPSTCKDKGSIVYNCTRDNCTKEHTVELAKNANAHQYETTVVDATCGTAGSVVTECKLCGDKITNETLAVKGHIWGADPIKSENATCEKDGYETYKCQNCDETNTVVLPKLGHEWGEWKVTKASTNTAKGELSRECSRGCAESVEIPEGGHNLVIKAKTYASCTEAGSVTYDCDAHTGDADCGIEITVELAKTQHQFTTTQKNATCTEAGEVVTKCDNCDTATITTVIPATGHTYNDGVKTDASCTAEGKIVYTCTAEKCGDTRTVVLEKKQHNYVAGTPVAATCTSSGYTPYKCETCESSYVQITASANGHKYETVENSTATCLADGTMTLKCACGDIMETEVPALGHNYEKKSETVATCAAAATETYECSRCDANYTVSVGSKTENHYWSEWTVVEVPTYTSIGYRTRTCNVCDKLEVETIEATGEHKFENGDIAESKNATCTEDGYEIRKCTVHTDCGKTATFVLPKLGHKEELQYQAATCTADGYSKIYCSTCDTVLDDQNIAKLDHVWTNETVTLSDCKTNGKVEYTCKYNCDATHSVELPLNKKAHIPKTTVTAATCTAAGSSVTVCAVCDEEIVRTELPKLQHIWGDWTVTTKATNTTEGEMTRTCNSGCTETVKFPAGGHTFGNEPDSIVPASCTATGTATYKCTAHDNCGVTITVTLAMVQHTIKTEIEDATCTKEGYVKSYCEVCKENFVDVTTGKLAHEFEVVETVQPDCDTSGYKVYKCKNCDETYKEITDDALAHNYVEVDGSSTANCVNGGTKTLKCDKCGKEISVTVPALGHTWGEGVVTKAPTCKEEGVITFTCTVCGDTMTEELPTISHKYSTETQKATCTEDGKVVTICAYCGETTTTTLPKLGHTWADTPATKGDATCESEGSATYKCTNENCTETKEVVIPALGHVYVAGTTVAPTCKTSGYTVYVCKNDESHTYNVYDASLTAIPHKFSDWEVITKATQDTEGLERRECACGTVEEKVIPAMKHNMVEDENVASTCTVKGYITYKCDTKHNGVVCDYTLTVELPTIAHTLTTDIEPATCENTGKVITTCTKCDTVNIETEIPALGHAWDEGKVTTAATCTNTGVMTYTCQHDNSHTYTKTIEKKQHEFVAQDEVAATCTENGYIPYKCKNCVESYEIITDAAKGHTYVIGESTATCEVGGAIQVTCENCDVVITITVDALGHNWGTGKVINQPTCSAEGTIEYECSRCGGNKTDKLPMVDHDYVVTTNDATCTEDGSVVTTCENCDYNKTEPIKAKGHTWATTPIADKTVNATCEAEGSETYACVNENCTATNVIVIPALGHVYEAEETVAPTCTTSGYTVYVCKNDASHTYKVYSESEAADGHDFGEWVIIDNATYDTDGLKRRDCKICDAYEEEAIPATKHEMSVKETKAATCKEEGYIIYECVSTHEGIDCSYTLKVTTSKIAHSLKTTVTPATCETSGSVVTVCATQGCTAVNETTVIPALGHKYVGTVTTEATCEGNGVMTYVCENDAKHTYTEVIPAKGHNYTPELTAPTCTTEGYTTYTCACGESYVDDKVSALGHNFGSWKDINDINVHQRTCSRCSEVETEAHRWDNGKVIVEPSYDNEGQTLYTCGICGDTKVVITGADVDNNAPTGKIKWNATIWNDFLSLITFGTYVNYDVVLEITAEDAETGIKSVEYYVSDEALTLDEVKALTDWKVYDTDNKLTVAAVDASKVVVYAKLTDESGNTAYLSTDGIVFDTTAPVLTIKADKGNAQTDIYCSNVTIEIDDANISHVIYDGKTVALTTDKFFCNEVGVHTVTVFDKAGNSTEITFTLNDGHTWTQAPLSDNSNLKSDATCEDKAVYYAACPVCGEIDKETTFEYGEALGHDYVGTVTTPATCEGKGVMTYICQNDAAHTYTEDIPANGHTAKDAVMENIVLVECEKDGSFDMVIYCDECGKELKRTSHTVTAIGHDYEGTVTKAPTCTEDGIMTYVCKHNSKHAYTQVIDALGHTDENYDCTCDVCGEKCCKETDLYIDRDLAIEPGCTTNGRAVLRCKNCDRYEETVIPALGHKEVETYYDATCNEFAYKVVTCSRCNDLYEKTYTDNVYTPHAVVVIPEKPATCVTDGYTAYEKCVNCGMVTESKTLYKEDVPHVDNDGNGNCDVCGGHFFTDTQTCNCLCHGTGIKGFLYKIALFFWRIFKINKSCNCGNVHY